MVTCGLLRTLKNQPGCLSAPPAEAVITYAEPSIIYIRGTVRCLPDLRPVVVSKRTFTPFIFPPRRPPVALYKKTINESALLIMDFSIYSYLHIPFHRAVRRPYAHTDSGMKMTRMPMHHASACKIVEA